MRDRLRTCKSTRYVTGYGVQLQSTLIFSFLPSAGAEIVCGYRVKLLVAHYIRECMSKTMRPSLTRAIREHLRGESTSQTLSIKGHTNVLFTSCYFTFYNPTADEFAHSCVFWATVFKTVRPMLSDRCLSVCLSCPVCDVRALWPNGWLNQDETWQAGRPRPWPHCVRWGSSCHSPKRAQPPPNFRPISLTAKWLHGSICHLVWS